MTVIAANAGRYPVSAQCRILGVPRAHEEGFREYGAPKIMNLNLNLPHFR